MRSILRSLPFVLALGLLPGCFGGGSSLAPPRTIGDQAHTTWFISDGLCGDGLFGDECDLGTRLATGAAPTVEIRPRGLVSLVGATLQGDAGLDVTGISESTDDGGTYLRASIGSGTAGTYAVRVIAADGSEIDRAHFTIVAPAAMRCGRLSNATTRDLAFAGLVAESTIDIVSSPGETVTSTTLACRVDDASGNPLLTTRAVIWSMNAGSVGTISVVSDDLFGSTPAAGGTAKVRTSGTGSGTVHAAIGTVSADIAITFR
ncbi:MAG: hypothetical protein U0234_27440 [Sandaracinus sp.]